MWTAIGTFRSTPSSTGCRLMTLVWALLLLVCWLDNQSVGVLALEGSMNSIKNLRSVTPFSALYRSATLDNLSMEEAETLLASSGKKSSGSPPRRLAAIIDLRNADEIQKGVKIQTEGAKLFYSNSVTNYDYLDMYDNLEERINDKNNQIPRLYQLPILADIDSFWDEAINRMDPMARAQATLQTAFSGGALDRAAARNLEQGGLASLYTVMLASAPREIGRVLKICSQELVHASSPHQQGGGVLFHCQKGKDRTGVIAMLLQSCLGVSDEMIVEEYSMSARLLGGDNGSEKDRNTGGLVDWRKFRGSPSEAMVDTMEWTRQQYGSIAGYLDFANFGPEERQKLRDVVLAAQSFEETSPR